MNDLYLIGNGFDLAHGLKTSYKDFLLWYLNDSLQNCNAKGSFNDNLMAVKRNGFQYSSLEDYHSVNQILEDMKRMEFSIKYHHYFFENLVVNYSGNKWVDIEYEYYMALIELYKKLDSGTYIKESIINQLKELNSCFESITKKLADYLSDHIKIEIECRNNQIDDILFDGTFNEKGKRLEKQMLFVCFNYTTTMELYLNNTIFKKDIIYIHGELNDLNNPIIFGYGDEIDPHYEKIENLNNNEFLKNIKSFSYFKTDNYQRVMNFLEPSDFTVKILGHSCGLSDRILLNTIFEHDNCKAIKIFHYDKSPTENDYFEKTQEISRHFKASKKGEMRRKIVPLDKYSTIPQNLKDN